MYCVKQTTFVHTCYTSMTVISPPNSVCIIIIIYCFNMSYIVNINNKKVYNNNLVCAITCFKKNIHTYMHTYKKMD